MQKTLLQRATALLTAAALTTTAAFAQAPTFEWGKSVTNSSGTGIYPKLVTDMSGNSYITNSFSAQIVINPSGASTSLTTASSSHYIAKYASDGTFIWAKQAPSGKIRYANGHIYVAGTFSGTPNFSPNPDTTISATSNGGTDIFVSKLDTAGNLIWVKTWGNANNDIFSDFNVEPNGTVVLGGAFTGSLDVDPNTATNSITTAGSTNESFLLSLSANGNFNWVQRFPYTSTFSSYELINSIVSNGAYGYLTLGVYNGSGNVSIGGTSISMPSGVNNFTYRPVVVQFNPANGNINWVKFMGQGEVESTIFAAIAGTNNDLVISFTSNVAPNTSEDYNPNAAVFNITHNATYENVVIKLDATGEFVFAKHAAGFNTTYYSYTGDLDADHTGAVYITNVYRDSINLNPSTNTNILYRASSNSYISKLDAAGNFAWGIGSIDSGSVRLSGVHIDNTGNIYAIGEHRLDNSSTCDIDFTSGTNFISGTGNLIFKLDQPTFVSVSRQAENTTPIRLFPNPAANFINIENAPIGSQLRIVDALGRTALSQIISSEYSQIATDALSNGVYFFQFHINGEATATQKIIIAK